MRLHHFALVAAVSLMIPAAARAAEATNRFGFTGPEIFPIDSQIGLLHAADIDGDGKTDIVVVNNARSKISLLFNQTGKTNSPAAKPTTKREMNELPPDARFRLDSIASEKRIAAMVVKDLNGDGRPDICYYGEPKELVLIYNQGTNGWSTPKRWPIEDGQLTPNGLNAGDLNGDKLTDLVLLAENHVYFFPQTKEHTFGEPEKIPFATPVKAAQLLDVDGDNRTDLMLVNWETLTPVRYRLQQPDGQLGPELYFTLPPIRSYWADNLEANEQTYVITIAQNSGRAQIGRFERKPAETLVAGFRQGQLQVLPLNKSEKSKRGTLWADVNGDGRTDLLVAEPESGKISVYLQKPDGTMATPKAFPSLAVVSDFAVADWDGDSKPEIFLLSAPASQGGEQQIGVTRFDDKGRLPFPTLIPFDGKPLAIAAGPLKPGSKPILAAILEKDDRRVLVIRTADGTTKTQKLSESLKSNPSSLAIVDVNQDGLADIVALIPYEKLKVLLQTSDGEFGDYDVAPPGGAMEQPWLATADVDGDGKAEVLLAQKNFLRAVVLKPEPVSSQDSTNKSGYIFEVKEQINGAGSNSRLVGATAVVRGDNKIASLFMLDAERKALTLCERDAAGVWQVVRNIQLPVSDFSGLQATALGGDHANSVGFVGANAVAWMPLSGDSWEYEELDGYETPVKNGYLNDVISGDLDSDGRKDLVFLETGKNHLDLVMFNAAHKLVPADRWQVFEQKSFRPSPGGYPEPREAVVADFTGDGKNDLGVVVHDRVLIYPQE